MRDPEVLSALLESKSEGELARKRGRDLKPFRGLRGVPHSVLIEVLVEAWQSEGVTLPGDEDLLTALFSEAHEDGIVAIGLLAVAALKAPIEALDLFDRWLELVDDVETADALGWLVVGPSLLSSGEPFAETLLDLKNSPRPHQRRIAVMACMAALPVPIEGAAAAALRAQMGERKIAFVEQALSDEIGPVLEAFIRDTGPPVQKALSRVLRTWASFDPDTVEAFINNIRGGVSKVLRAEVELGLRKGRRKPRPNKGPPDGGSKQGDFTDDAPL